MQANEQQHPYIFGDAATDRFRLETQTRLFSDYLRGNARRLVGDDIHRILDLGCGEGQLALVLHDIYPAAHIVGIDRDERALDKARQMAKEAGADNVEYVLGDVQQGLPVGPFDLVYASMVLQHLTNANTVLDSAFKQLHPGGYLWVKMPDAQTLTAFNNAAYRELFRLFYTAISKLGGDPYLHDHIEATLQHHGFTDIRTEYEEYPLGGLSKDGQTMMGITLGIFYNGRNLMAKMNDITEQRVIDLYLQVVNAATILGKEVGTQIFRDDIARKPEQ